MGDALNGTDLDVLQAAIEADIAAAFPDLKTVEFYGEIRSGMTLPACQLDIEDWENFNEPDPGTGQQSTLMKFAARFIISGVRTKQAKHTIRKLSAAFTAFLYQRRWSDAENPGKKLATPGAAEFLRAYPDHFNPDLDQFEVWCVEWQQVVNLGDNVWADDGTTPSQVFLGFTPDIGPGNEPDYVEVTAEP
jgi:hypothetical protein